MVDVTSTANGKQDGLLAHSLIAIGLRRTIDIFFGILPQDLIGYHCTPVIFAGSPTERVPHGVAISLKPEIRTQSDCMSEVRRRASRNRQSNER